MIQGWRRRFEQPGLPFVYVELCTEYGAPGFWEAQRAAAQELPSVGFATTTDIQRALHPPVGSRPTATQLHTIWYLCYLRRFVGLLGLTLQNKFMTKKSGLRNTCHGPA